MSKSFLVYCCYGIGDILMASGLVRKLLLDGHNVHLVTEEFGPQLYDEEIRSQLASFTTYLRNPNMTINPEELLYKTRDIEFDELILTVPSNEAEGSFLSKGCPIHSFGKDEWELRRFRHTMDLNTELYNRATGNSCRNISYGSNQDFRYINEDSKIVLLHVGSQHSGWRHKAFPITLFKSICERLISEGYSPHIIGDDKQTVYAKMLSQSGAVDSTGCSLSDTINLIKKSVCYIGNDSGAAHLCASYALPTITLFGPTLATRTGPFPVNQRRNRALQAIIPCGPCHMTERMEKCKKAICHDTISLKDVVSIFNTLISEGYINGKCLD